MNKISLFWILVVFVLFGIFYFLSDILLPFFLAYIFAYLLSPLIDLVCNKYKLGRSVVSFIIFLIFVGLLILAFASLIPIIYEQLYIFIKKLPVYKNNLEQAIFLYKERFSEKNFPLVDNLVNFAKKLVDVFFGIFLKISHNIWGYTLVTINLLLTIILFPIILYYLLQDWHKIKDSIDSVFPLKHKSLVYELFVSIDNLIFSYLKGQINVSMIIALYYTTMFLILKLDFAILTGIMIGILIIIPFIGLSIGFIISMINCYFTYGLSVQFTCLILIFIFGHVLEAYVLSPKIVGNRVGLHPLWVIFSVFAFGHLLGFWGIFFAIPIAATIRVVILNLISYYKGSELYKS